MSYGRTKRILVLLYGDISFDGRVKRIIEIAAAHGDVILVDVSEQRIASPVPGVAKHERIVMKKNWGNVRRHLSFWVRCLSAALSHRPATVFAEDFFTTFAGYMSARMTRAHLVYDAHELIIPEKDGGRFLREQFWYYLERFTVHRCNLVIAANPERAEIMQRHYRLPVCPTYMRNIPRWPEAKAIPVSDLRSICGFLVKSGPSDKIVIYQGVMSIRRGIDRFVEAMSYLPPNFRLILVGDGPDLERLKQMGRLLESENRFSAIGRVSNDQLAAITAVCDVGVVTYPYSGVNNIYCAPNKIYEYAQAGVPMIATNQPPIERLFKTYAIGETISRFDSVQEAAQKILRIAVHGEWRAELERFLRDNRSDVEYNRISEALARMVK